MNDEQRKQFDEQLYLQFKISEGYRQSRWKFLFTGLIIGFVLSQLLTF